jgi:GntR family transcriptional regulator, transcriptional repressor for pyruvate dehydrogenase complex
MSLAKPTSRVQSRISEAVAADIRQRILRGTYPEGPLPKQDDLIDEYGVSGPSLREALRILEAEGLITVRRGKFGGAFIHPPSWSSAAYALGLSMQGQGVRVHDLAAAIRDLEPRCAESCAMRDDRRETVVPALEANIADSEKVVGDGAHFTAVSRKFHDVFVDFAENQTLRLVVRSLVAVWTIQEQAWADAMVGEGHYPVVEQQHAVLEAHRAIAHLVARGDKNKVVKVATEHLAATQPRVLQFCGDRIVDASSETAVRGFRGLGVPRRSE